MLDILIFLPIGIAVVYFVWSLTADVKLSAWLIVVVCILNGLFGDFLIFKGPVNISARDVLAFLFLSRSIIFISRGFTTKSKMASFAPIILILMIGIGLFRSIDAGISLKSSINGSRLLFHSTAAMLYFSLCPNDFFIGPDFCHWIRKVLFILLVGLPLKMITEHYGLTPVLGNDEIGVRRLVNSDYAIELALCTGFLWNSQIGKRIQFVDTALVLIGLASIVWLQHRSVWTATIAFFAVGALFGDSRARMQVVTLISLVVVGLMAFFRLAGDSIVAKAIVSSFIRAVEQKDTVKWRYDSWQSMLTDSYMGTSLNWTVGRPLGLSMTRKTASGVITTMAHNYYVEMLCGLGIVGITVFILSLVLVIWQLKRYEAEWIPWVSVFFGSFVFWISYPANIFQLAMIGMAYSLALRKKRVLYENPLYSQTGLLKSATW